MQPDNPDSLEHKDSQTVSGEDLKVATESQEVLEPQSPASQEYGVEGEGGSEQRDSTQCQGQPVYQAQPVPHKPQASYQQPQRAESEGFSRDSQYYAQQLIDVLQKRNRFMGVIVVFMVLISIASAFGAFKFYLDQQVAIQSVSNLQDEEGEQKQTIVALQQKLDQLQLQHGELVQTADLKAQQLSASSSKLDTAQQMVQALKTNLELVKAQNQQLEQENVIIRSALDTTAAGKEKTLSLIDEKEELMKQQREQLSFNQQQNKELKKEVANRKNAFEALSKRYQNIKGDVFSLEQTLDQSNRQLAAKNKELKRLNSQVSRQKSEIDTLKDKHDELKQEYAGIKQEYTSLQNSLHNSLKPVATAPVTSKANPSEQKKSVPPLTSGQSNTLDIPDQVIIDLN